MYHLFRLRCFVAATSNGDRPFRMFVKSVQNWSRSPQFAMVASEIREMAAASVPWRTEASVYRSDLANRLPEGLSMPRALAVIDIDALSSAMTRPDRGLLSRWRRSGR
jgi:hypothetical protein